MAHIQKRKDKWKARYRDPNGRERSRVFDRLIDAQRFTATVESDKARGIWYNPALGNIPLYKWVKSWLAEQGFLKPKTLASYETILRTHILPNFGHTPIGNVKQRHVAEWISGLGAKGLSTARTRQSYFVLSGLMRAAEHRGLIARTPCVGIRLPRQVSREARFITALQVQELVDHTIDPYKPLSTLWLIADYVGEKYVPCIVNESYCIDNVW